MGYVIPKNSSYTAAFTYLINQFIEGGTVDRLKEIYQGEDQVCPTYQGKPLGIQKCFSLFGINSVVNTSLLVSGSIKEKFIFASV